MKETYEDRITVDDASLFWPPPPPGTFSASMYGDDVFIRIIDPPNDEIVKVIGKEGNDLIVLRGRQT